ncbi:hypothetical protein OG884_18420 [Streptosporangium sp. NBC_01755]|uniref:hypothetical protein n=1 Tax=unclassified Streptosporangium TaxID=2632669 RepID=UPI002DDB4F14|nr:MULTISPECIES: hypothetical protein [unclassified Streptosporangium]WSA23752.1 hypothetical protein OIE13_22685 [Streptosporangium sp. NBC_01810]WSD03782.1 hypothetical protein OG884_18420 [Streptosporangium sp. NBC_01755]
MRLRPFVVGLAGGITAGLGVLVLRLMQPASLDFSPFVYVAVASLVLAAAAGVWHLILARWGRR